jgi:hypothetical protein
MVDNGLAMVMMYSYCFNFKYLAKKNDFAAG